MGPGETLQLTENAPAGVDWRFSPSRRLAACLETEAGLSSVREGPPRSSPDIRSVNIPRLRRLPAVLSIQRYTARLLRHAAALAMQKAVPVAAGAMAALLGLDYGGRKWRSANEAAQGQVLPGPPTTMEGRPRSWSPGRQGRRRSRAALEKSPKPGAPSGPCLLLPVSAAVFTLRADARPAGRSDGKSARGCHDPSRRLRPLVSNVTSCADQRSGRDPPSPRSNRVTGNRGVWAPKSVAYMAKPTVSSVFFRNRRAGRFLSGLVKRIAEGCDWHSSLAAPPILALQKDAIGSPRHSA